MIDFSINLIEDSERNSKLPNLKRSKFSVIVAKRRPSSVKVNWEGKRSYQIKYDPLNVKSVEYYGRTSSNTLIT